MLRLSTVALFRVHSRKLINRYRWTSLRSRPSNIEIPSVKWPDYAVKVADVRDRADLELRNEGTIRHTLAVIQQEENKMHKADTESIFLRVLKTAADHNKWGTVDLLFEQATAWNTLVTPEGHYNALSLIVTYPSPSHPIFEKLIWKVVELKCSLHNDIVSKWNMEFQPKIQDSIDLLQKLIDYKLTLPSALCDIILSKCIVEKQPEQAWLIGKVLDMMGGPIGGVHHKLLTLTSAMKLCADSGNYSLAIDFINLIKQANSLLRPFASEIDMHLNAGDVDRAMNVMLTACYEHVAEPLSKQNIEKVTQNLYRRGRLADMDKLFSEVLWGTQYEDDVCIHIISIWRNLQQEFRAQYNLFLEIANSAQRVTRPIALHWLGLPTDLKPGCDRYSRRIESLDAENRLGTIPMLLSAVKCANSYEDGVILANSFMRNFAELVESTNDLIVHNKKKYLFSAEVQWRPRRSEDGLVTIYNILDITNEFLRDAWVNIVSEICYLLSRNEDLDAYNNLMGELVTLLDSESIDIIAYTVSLLNLTKSEHDERHHEHIQAFVQALFFSEESLQLIVPLNMHLQLGVEYLNRSGGNQDQIYAYLLDCIAKRGVTKDCVRFLLSCSSNSVLRIIAVERVDLPGQEFFEASLNKDIANGIIKHAFELARQLSENLAELSLKPRDADRLQLTRPLVLMMERAMKVLLTVDPSYDDYNVGNRKKLVELLHLQNACMQGRASYKILDSTVNLIIREHTEVSKVLSQPEAAEYYEELLENSHILLNEGSFVLNMLISSCQRFDYRQGLYLTDALVSSPTFWFPASNPTIIKKIGPEKAHLLPAIILANLWGPHASTMMYHSILEERFVIPILFALSFADKSLETVKLFERIVRGRDRIGSSTVVSLDAWGFYLLAVQRMAKKQEVEIYDYTPNVQQTLAAATNHRSFVDFSVFSQLVGLLIESNQINCCIPLCEAILEHISTHISPEEWLDYILQPKRIQELQQALESLDQAEERWEAQERSNRTKEFASDLNKLIELREQIFNLLPNSLEAPMEQKQGANRKAGRGR